MPYTIPVTDFADPALDVYARRTEAQLRSEEGLFIAESPLVIGRALDAGYEPVSCLAEDKTPDAQTAMILARVGDVPVYTAPFSVLTQLTGFKLTRGLLCAMRRRAIPTAGDICRTARRVAVLEDVMNPTNLGAIFRSAAALNVDAVLLTAACTDPFYRRAARVSMGNVFLVPWTELPADADYMALLRSLGFVTAAFALRDDSVSIRDRRLCGAERLAIVLGSEGPGLRDETIAACDYTVKIPMSHGVDSLNVAAASAVAFWQLCCGEE